MLAKMALLETTRNTEVDGIKNSGVSQEIGYTKFGINCGKGGSMI